MAGRDVMAPRHAPDGSWRPLGPVERWYWITDQVSPLNGVCVARVHARLPERLWRAALDVLSARHPLLNVVIATDEDGANPRFVPADGLTVPLRYELPAEPAEADRGAGEPYWVAEVNGHALVERVDQRSGPLARAVVLDRGAAGGRHPEQCLVLTLPHYVADGTTGLSLMREWIEAAAELEGHLPPSSGTPATSGTPGTPGTPGASGISRVPYRALPSVEELLPAAHRGDEGARRSREQQTADARTMAELRPLRVVPTRTVPFTERRTRLLHRELTPHQLDVLVAACRAQGTTVHGALAAAMVTAVARASGARAQEHVSIGSPVDFRGELEPPVLSQEMGAYVATVPTVARYRPDRPLWETARHISADVAARKQRGEPLSAITTYGSMCPETPAGAAPLLRFMDEEGPINLCLSNLGRVDFPDKVGPWEVSDAQLIAGLSVNGQFVGVVNTSHGHLFWNFTYIDGALADGAAEALADDCLTTLLSALPDAPPAPGSPAKEGP
ncbi:phthiocerol/phthiodiolone dimycocerosyl transferase family protein [Streptomyces sp. NBRC 110611]|uniref:phthiocerol/phthiodiolone dimycocerosyl transferase family protein n=1 Tax=Streptomyces sp. NBRC 110611 TaxID=1621259 RepID=UPI001C677F65|nr:short-chain dehydrogenase [Streptomyces sp. NBRC 110611]